ncbi:MAG: hypothetical protein Q9208_007891 [Pyrenodesmia sp. 3 TL-2023]
MHERRSPFAKAMRRRKAPTRISTRNLWNLLPVELRVEVQKNIRDLPTLRNLIVASPADQSIFRQYFYEIWRSVFSDEDNEIRSSISVILCHRLSFAPYSNSVAGELQAYISHHVWPALANYCGNDAVAILFYLAECTDTVNRWVAGFARRRVIIPSGAPAGRLSPVEVHRIRRAFWRFCALCQRQIVEERSGRSQPIHKEPRFISAGVRGRYDPGNGWLFTTRRWDWDCATFYDFFDLICSKLSGWEMDELNAVRGFVRDEVNSIQLNRIQSRCMLPDQPLLIQRLIKELDHLPQRPDALSLNVPATDQSFHILAMNPGGGRPAVRSLREWSWSPPKTPERKANLDTCKARLLWRHQSLLGNSEDWGYCMWDRSRLLKCGLLRGKDPEFIPDTEPAKLSNWIKATGNSHKRCAELLNSTIDHRIKVRFDADVERIRQNQLQRANFENSKGLLEWTRMNNPSLYEDWTSVITADEYSRQIQRKAEVCYNKALLLITLACCQVAAEDSSTEESDLQLLVRFRACRYPP